VVIDGPLWFIGALVICGWFALYHRSRRREYRQYMAWCRKYDADAQQRHAEFMHVMNRVDGDAYGWNLDGSRERGQA